MANVATSSEYRDQLIALLPPGAAIPKDPDSMLGQLLHGFGNEFARVEERGRELINEADASSAIEMLTDWEIAYVLPDSCAPAEQSTAQRRSALLAKVAGLGGQSIQYYINLATTYGYNIQITELGGYVWQVYIPNVSTWRFRCGSRCGERLYTSDAATLACILQKLKPAHTQLDIVYVLIDWLRAGEQINQPIATYTNT